MKGVSWLSIEESYEKYFYNDENLEFIGNKTIDYKITEEDWYHVRQLSDHDWDQPFIVFHGRVGNQNRTIPPEFWEQLANLFLEKKYTIILVGSRGDVQMHGPNVINLVGKTNLPILRALLERSALFIGVDSGPMHVADGACKAIGIFTIADPEKRVSKAVTPFVAPVPCRGCLHRQKTSFDKLHL